MAKSMQPIVALKALRQLIANPEDTEKVFDIIRAMAGNATERCADRFKKTDSGIRILSQQGDLMDLLTDSERLRAMVPDSLGRVYLHFLENEGLTARGLQKASEQQGETPFNDPGVQFFAIRLRDQHDLWHITTGYGRDVAGEACLLAFTYAQTGNRGVGLITLFAALKLYKFAGTSIFRSIWQGYKAGRKAAWLPAQEWESLLELPLTQVREQLNINEPHEYVRMTQALAA